MSFYKVHCVIGIAISDIKTTSYKLAGAVGITLGTCFGSKEYSFEELFAEIGSCFLTNQAGIEKP